MSITQRRFPGFEVYMEDGCGGKLKVAFDVRWVEGTG